MTASSLLDLPLDRASKEPLWQQLSGVLRTAIDAEIFGPDQALPSEAELIDLYGVSRTVVREALADLVQRGRIYKIRAKGSFVSPPRRDLNFIGSTRGSSADLVATGRSMSTRVLDLDVRAATPREAEALKIEPGSRVIRLRRLRSVDGTPWLLVDTTLPQAMFPGITRAKLENWSLYEYLRRHYGKVPAGADRWLTAVIPSADDSALLELEPGAPVLHIESVTWGEDNVPFEYYNALHRTDETRFYLGIR
ncbi:MAG: GntR family transcriptional regulator [Microbacteriaceae bacterium]